MSDVQVLCMFVHQAGLLFLVFEEHYSASSWVLMKIRPTILQMINLSWLELEARVLFYEVVKVNDVFVKQHPGRRS